jgi:hypothetical protein
VAIVDGYCFEERFARLPCHVEADDAITKTRLMHQDRLGRIDGDPYSSIRRRDVDAPDLLLTGMYRNRQYHGGDQTQYKRPQPRR